MGVIMTVLQAGECWFVLVSKSDWDIICGL